MLKPLPELLISGPPDVCESAPVNYISSATSLHSLSIYFNSEYKSHERASDWQILSDTRNSSRKVSEKQNL